MNITMYQIDYKNDTQKIIQIYFKCNTLTAQLQWHIA